MRVKNSIKNIITGILLQFIVIILGIVSRKVFFDNLGVELLGVNGVLTNIISMLSLTELGVGIAISYSLYKPLAEGNYNQIKAIMNLYSKFYKFIAIAIGLIGLIILPFLSKIIKTEYSNEYIMMIFSIFLIDSIMSYFLSYRRNLLSADQKNYVLNRVTTIFSVSTTLIQILVMYITKNYILFILIKLVTGVIQNLVIFKITNKRYSFLKEKNEYKLDTEIKNKIILNVKSLFLANISNYCIFGTDNLLLSTFVGVTTVGIFSNYILIINSVKGLISQIFLGTTASYGNYLVSEEINKADEIFDVLYFVNFWISTFCAISLFILLNPFISIWLDSNMVLPITAVAIIVFNFYSDTMRSAIELVRSASGLYSPYPFFKYWIVIEAIVNLVVSIILAGPMKMGMFGIFLGTAISTAIATYVLPWNVYKYVFNRNSKKYYVKHFIYLITSLILVILTYSVSEFININNSYLSLIVKGMICIIIPNTLIVIFFSKTNEFKYVLKRFLKQAK